jgi:hypothetical protein
MNGVNQIIDCGKAFFVDDISKMGITSGCFGAGMAQDSLDMP